MRRLIVCAVLLAGLAGQPASAEETLYQQVGGQDGIDRIVKGAVALYVSDERIKGDFDNINLDRLRKKLAEQLCQITNGPCVYRGRPMKASHAGLELTQAKFNAVAEDFQTAMEQAGIPYRTQNRVMALLAPMERDIVTR
jgi:hemoglobin